MNHWSPLTECTLQLVLAISVQKFSLVGLSPYWGMMEKLRICLLETYRLGIKSMRRAFDRFPGKENMQTLATSILPMPNRQMPSRKLDASFGTPFACMTNGVWVRLDRRGLAMCPVAWRGTDKCAQQGRSFEENTLVKQDLLSFAMS